MASKPRVTIAATVAAAALAAGCGTVSTTTSGTPRPREAASLPAERSLPCDPDQQFRAMLDMAGPGKPTPTEAVTQVFSTVSGASLRTHVSGRTATVLQAAPNGGIARVYQATRARDGWWLDSYTECKQPPTWSQGEASSHATP